MHGLLAISGLAAGGFHRRKPVRPVDVGFGR